MKGNYQSQKDSFKFVNSILLFNRVFKMKIITYISSIFLFLLFSFQLSAQTDSLEIRKIYDEALTNGEGYENLRVLCKDIGHRLSGSAAAEKSVKWSEDLMMSYGFDSVWLEPVMVPKWVRGEPEKCHIVGTDKNLDALALGFSVGTNGKLKGKVVEFQTMQALKSAPVGSLKGKIVFMNQPMNQKLIDTFHAYSGCAGARVYGPSEASKKGAVGYVMRSLGLRADDFPHTGIMVNEEGVDSIPAFALSTNASYYLSNELRKNPDLELEMEANCKLYPDVESFNVIAETKGNEFPNKIITVGGHLDSWDVGEGAHDDGAGIVESLEVLRIFKKLDITPRHSIRCVFFMNEENGSRGAIAYAENCKERGDIHLAAMESDRGGFTPRGFHIDSSEEVIAYLNAWLPLLEPYQIHIMQKGYGGVDINHLKDTGAPLIGVVPDSQRYFDIHHTANDVFEHVNQRELELSTASMASLIYLIDKYGIPGR